MRMPATAMQTMLPILDTASSMIKAAPKPLPFGFYEYPNHGRSQEKNFGIGLKHFGVGHSILITQ